MMNNLDFINDIIEKYKQKIDEFPIKIDEGTKKAKKLYYINQIKLRNEIVDSLKADCVSYSQQILEKIKEKYLECTPQDCFYMKETKENDTKLLFKVIRYTNKYNDYIDKMNLTKILNDIDDIDNNDLRNVIDSLLYVITKLKRANVILGESDFNYSNYTRDFMNYFFTNLNDSDFDSLMSNKFNEIYWSCPNLIKQLKLNLKLLLPKHKKELEKYCNDRKIELFSKTNTNEGNCYDTLLNCETELELLDNENEFFVTNRFLGIELNVSDFDINGNKMGKAINSFLNDNFSNLVEESREKFFKSIIELGYYIEEFENYNYFEILLNDIKKRYLEKDKNKGIYDSKLKEFNKLESNRIKLIRKKNSRFSFNKNNNSLDKKINDTVEELSKLTLEMDDARINEKIYKYLNEDSTIYDGMILANSFYDYMKKTVSNIYGITDKKEIDEVLKKFNSFVYSSHNVIVKNIKLFSQFDIKDMIINKCKLFDIVLSDDLENLKEKINLISLLYHFENGNINLEKIKFLVEASKLV